MKNLFILFCLFTCHMTSFSLGASEQEKGNLNLILRAEILEMCEKDQDIRLEWINAQGTEIEAHLLDKMIQIDTKHAIRIKEIIDSYGWPGSSLIGTDGSHAMWLLIQHSADLAFQKRCLILLEEAVAHQEADIINFAYLKDRVLIYEGEKQIYGTQFQLINNELVFYPIEDEEHVNERRLSIGLCSLEEYIEEARQMYKTTP